MTASAPARPESPPTSDSPRAPSRRGRRRGNALSVLARGEPLIWLTAGALVMCVVMVATLLLGVLGAGMATFWPSPLARVETLDDSVWLGEVTRSESYRIDYGNFADLSPALQITAGKQLHPRLRASVQQRLQPTAWPRAKKDIAAAAGSGVATGLQYATAVVESAGSEQADVLLQVATLLQQRQAELTDRLHAQLEPRLSDASGEALFAWWNEQRQQADQWLQSPSLEELRSTLENDPDVLFAAWSVKALDVLARDAHLDVERRLLRIGNFELTNAHFQWINELEIAPQGESAPEWAVVVERLAWGRFYGEPQALSIDGVRHGNSPAEVWKLFEEHHPAARGRWRQRRELEEGAVGDLNRRLERARLAIRQAEMRHGPASEQRLQAQAEFERLQAELRPQFDRIGEEIDRLQQENDRYRLVMQTAQAQEQELALGDIVRAYPANQLGWNEKLGVYLSRWREYLLDEPREANTEGGVFPAIFGTVAMTLLMSLVVTPFGVLAAVYLREYARTGPLTSAIRIAINNLAGVPSIVFGVFGLGFFCYVIGGFIDGGPRSAGLTPLGPTWWFAALAIAAAVAVTAFGCGLLSFTSRHAAASSWRAWAGRISVALWIAATLLFIVVLFRNPYFGGLYAAKLPSPTFGTGGLFWSALTLALLTAPVVIVATEEALAAVPNSMREGAYACGASKWQTIRGIVLPRALPGIMTGMILAMARGAGEVAPLMLVGAVKIAPELPLDHVAPFIHLERSYMHLGFHIFDLGFQSQNSEAAKPMVFTTTLLLISIIAALNLFAIALRARLRRKFVSSQF